MAKPRVLYTTPILEHPPAGGPALRIENSIKALHRVSELHVISRVDPHYLGGAAAEAFYRSTAHIFMSSPSVTGTSDNYWIRMAQEKWRRPSAVRKDAEFVAAYMQRYGIDILWAGYGNISFELIARVKALVPSIKIVCDTDSVWSRFVLRKLPYVTSPRRRRRIEQAGRKKEEEERAWVNLCEVTTAVSDIDADYYRSLTNETERVHIFSNVIDVDSYLGVPPPPRGHKRPNIYLAGTFGNDGPMDQAARWLVGNVFSHVQREIPDIHLYLVGALGDVSLTDLAGPHITITGKLPSVLPYLRHADVAVVPLFFESGTRFKILEAGACGIPIVSTTLGAEGLPLQNGKEILIADEPEPFAADIVRLIRDRPFAAQMAATCRGFVEENCGIPRLVREAQSILDTLKASSDERPRSRRRN
ncbi:MAG TPA: glycosyltransferase [Thermoanaerobaculia bacterium]|nr:glycosyltransferase [Thermoanaerobaculia bacterium]